MSFIRGENCIVAGTGTLSPTGFVSEATPDTRAQRRQLRLLEFSEMRGDLNRE